MESTENLTPLNVEQLANLLLRAYLAMVRSGTPFQKFPWARCGASGAVQN